MPWGHRFTECGEGGRLKLAQCQKNLGPALIGRDRSSDVLLLEPSPYGAIEYILFIFLFNILIVKDQVTNIILFIIHATRNSGHG